MIGKRSGAFVLLCIIVVPLLVFVFGKSQKGNPHEKVFRRASVRNENKLVESLNLAINNVDIYSGKITLQRGGRATLTGKIELSSPEKNGELTMVMLIVGFRSKGSPESSWRDAEPSREWIGSGKPKLEFNAIVNQAPGEYDFRVYVLTHVVGAEFSTVDYVASGVLAVVE